MAIIKLNVKLDTGFANAQHTDVIDVEVDDDATEEETNQALEDATREWAFNFIDYSYERIN